MSSKITHLPPGLAHGTQATKPEPRPAASSRASGPAKAGAKGRAKGQAAQGDEELFHQDLHENAHEGRHKEAGHERQAPAPSQAKALAKPATSAKTKTPRTASGAPGAQGREAAVAPPQIDPREGGPRAEQLRWAQLLQSVPQERLATGQAVLEQHAMALEAFASKVALLRRGR